MTSIYAAILLAVNTVCLLLVPAGLPGTWLMVLASAGVSWLAGWSISIPVLGILAALAAAGEVIELMAGAAGSKRAGGTWRGSGGALLMGMVGGILGTIYIPIPILGSILGACSGAFIGAMGGEMWGGKDSEIAARIGKGAFVGRLLGTLYKMAVGAAIWIVATVASIF